jgi:hypothetical protein
MIMEPKTIPLDYANSLLFEMEKAFWDERGKGARFRMTTIGRQFFEKECLPLLDSSEVEDILRTIGKIIQSTGIAATVTYSSEDRLLKLRVESCLHRPVEDRFLAHGIEPFACMPANLIVLAIEEKLDRPVELAEIKPVDGACELLLVMFGERPRLD